MNFKKISLSLLLALSVLSGCNNSLNTEISNSSENSSNTEISKKDESSQSTENTAKSENSKSSEISITSENSALINEKPNISDGTFDTEHLLFYSNIESRLRIIPVLGWDGAIPKPFSGDMTNENLSELMSEYKADIENYKDIYIRHLTGFKNSLDENGFEGINVYSLLAPTQAEFYIPESWDAIHIDQKKIIDNIYSRLGNAGIKTVPAYEELSKRTAEEIYLYTDHHWTPLGAYYAASAFAKTIGTEIYQLDDENFEAVTVSDWTGSASPVSDYNSLVFQNPENFTYWKTRAEIKFSTYDTNFKNPKKDNYYHTEFHDSPWIFNLYGGGADKIFKIETENQTKNNKKLLVIGDSFSNAVLTHLFSVYDEVYYYDLRYFEIDGVELIEKAGITDVLFLDDVMLACSHLAPNFSRLYS